MTFTIQADGYTADDGPIPLHIIGTDLDGNAVDTTAYIAADGTGTELSAGSYTASVAASPLMQDGSLYAVPDASHALRIPESDDEMPEEVTSDQPIALTKLDASAETDELIDAAYQAAIASGMDSGKDSAYQQAAKQKRTDAEAAQQAAAQKAATEKAAADAHEAYSAFLSQFTDSYQWRDDKGVSLSECKFVVIDIDGDGVDELLLESTETSHADGYQQLLQYRNGAVSLLLRGSESFKIFKSGAVLNTFVATRGSNGWYYTIAKGTAAKVAEYITEYDEEGTTPMKYHSFFDPGGMSWSNVISLKVTGQEVDLDTYLATARKLADADITPETVQNTAENRQKLLG